ncbi:MAG: PD40 domain-containing protein [Actinobacteria bacterium]|nr:PD40 domain-containing protein [Actinomycetota bacterium]
MNRLVRLTVAVAATALTLTSLGAVPAGATTSDHDSIIVATRFSDANGGQPQIVATTPQGGRLRVLTTGHQDSDPHMSPDGKRIVFQRCVDAFDCDNVGRTNIWVMNADGSHQHALTQCDASRCLGAFNPAFSPDGRWITFTEDLLDANGVNFNGVFVMRTDGTHPRRVTSNGPDNLPDLRPQFSPDGRSIVFNRETTDGDRLMTVHADGTGLRALLPGVDGFSASWSPDGRRIAFSLARHLAGGTTLDVATVRPDGTGLRVVTDSTDGTASFFPAWSPDGSRIVFTRGVPDGCALVVARPDGSRPKTLDIGAGCFLDANWGRAASG